MADTASKPPILSVEVLTRAIGNPLRWRILTEISLRGPLMVSEIADALGSSMSHISKHIAILRKTGTVEQIRGRMHTVPARHIVGIGVLDFGYGPFRMKPTPPAA
jgi:predicted transcriptional regulator